MMIKQQKALSPAGGYNEVIIDSESWVRHLPRTVMAVFVHKDAPLADVVNSQRVHSNFLQQYGITSDETPLVSYDEHTGEFTLFDGTPSSKGDRSLRH